MNPTQEQLEFGTTSLLMALSARNLETGNHCPRVNRLSLQLGRAFKLRPDDLNTLKFGSLLHDVGKLRTPDAVLCKPAPLTPEEWAEMRRHPIDGANILRSLGYPEAICLIVEQHHERYDGKGYPFGLQGNQISIGARIFAIADTYDAITANRCYQSARSSAFALHEITSGSGGQFDPEIVDKLPALDWPSHEKTA